DVNVCPLTHRYDMDANDLTDPNYQWTAFNNWALTKENAPATGNACGADTTSLGTPPIAGGADLVVSSNQKGASCQGTFWIWNATTNSYTYNGINNALTQPKFGFGAPGFDVFVANLGPVCASNAPQPKFGPLVSPGFTANPGDASGAPAP